MFSASSAGVLSPMALVRLLFIITCGSLMVVSEESRIAIQSRKVACKNLGGKCIKRKKDCPNRLPMETQPGSPYCNKRRRCCHPGGPPGPTEPTVAGCPDDGVIVAGQCLTFSTGRSSWEGAKGHCLSLGGRLASIADPTSFLDYVVSTYGNEQFWLGGSDIENEGDWVWLNGQSLGDDFPWIGIEPNNGGHDIGEENCLQTFIKKYNDAQCHGAYRYVCEYGPVGPPGPPGPTEPTVAGCRDDGVIIAGQCLTFSTEKLSWYDAKDNCSSLGGRLASLVNPSSPTSFLSYAGYIYGVTEWWLGGSRSDNDEWVWLNGQPFGDQFPWIASEPNNEGGDENCLQTFSGRFNDRKCSLARRFVCEFGTVEGSVEIEATDGMEVYWETPNYDGTTHYPEGVYCYTNNITITSDYDMFMVNMEMVGPASIYYTYDCTYAYFVYTNADGETSRKYCNNLSGVSWKEKAAYNTPRHFSFKFCSLTGDRTDIGFRMKITGKDLKPV